MSTSVATGLSKPDGDKKISSGTLAYINARALLRAHSLVLKELGQSGISQAQLARRLGKAPEIISRLLSRPSNLELKTLSELLFAISGAVLSISVTRPLESNKAAKFYKVGPYGDVTAESAVTDPKNIKIRRAGIGIAAKVSAKAS